MKKYKITERRITLYWLQVKRLIREMQVKQIKGNLLIN